MSREAVAAYIAKYATESSDQFGRLERVRHDGDLELLDANDHIVEIVRAAWKLGGLRDLADLKLRRWAHALGYRGHWSTKSRHYSTTLGALRDERRQVRQAPQRRARARGGRLARRLALRRHRPPDRNRRLARRLRRRPAPHRTTDRSRGADDEVGSA